MGRASSNPAALEGGNGWRDIPVDIKPGVAELDHAVARQGFVGRRAPWRTRRITTSSRVSVANDGRADAQPFPHAGPRHGAAAVRKSCQAIAGLDRRAASASASIRGEFGNAIAWMAHRFGINPGHPDWPEVSRAIVAFGGSVKGFRAGAPRCPQQW